MTFLRRIKNLWLLSNFKITKTDDGKVNVFVNNENEKFVIKEKPKHMAEVIKKSNPVEEALKEEI